MTVGRFLLVLLAITYLVIATMTWRRAAWVFADKARYDPEQGFTSFEIVWGIAIGAVFAAIWPVTVAVWLVTTRGIAFLGNRFLLPPSHVRRERDAQEAAEQERRIAELEQLIESADR
jgi:hypothetical protein